VRLVRLIVRRVVLRLRHLPNPNRRRRRKLEERHRTEGSMEEWG
jgi:hypothetical protein